MSPEQAFEASLAHIINTEIEKLVNEIAWIDSRLLELGDDDESRIEKKLLTALRRHLLRDLYDLAGFVWDEAGPEALEMKEEGESAYVRSVVLEYAGIEA